MIKERQKLVIYSAILILLANLSLSILTQYNFQWQNSENSLDFHNPILLFVNSSSLSLIAAEKQHDIDSNYQRANKNHIAPIKNYFYQTFISKNYILKQKLLKIFENYKLEGG